MTWASLEEVGRAGLFSDGDWVESKDQDPQGTVRLTQLADVGVGMFRDRSDRWMREDQASRLNCTFLEPGDVLIARMPDPIGRSCVVPPTIGRAVTAVDVAILRADTSSFEPAYVAWMINAPQFHMRVEALQSGTTRKRISRRNLSTLSIPRVSLSEQRRIVEILEEHLSHLDAAADYASAALARAASLREELIRRTVTGADVTIPRSGCDLTDAGTQDGDLPSLPQGWTWRRLGDVAEVVGGVTKDSKKQSLPGMVEVPYLRVANVQRGALKLDEVSSIRVTPQKAQALELRAGDVLLNEGGDRDKLARGWVWEGEVPNCIHQNHVFRARLRIDLDPYFLSYTANTLGGRWAERNGKQSVNLASISLSMIRRMPVIVPPEGVSARVVNELRDRLEEVDRLEKAAHRSQAHSASLRRAILAAAFEGKLTGRHADTEVIEDMVSGHGKAMR